MKDEFIEELRQVSENSMKRRKHRLWRNVFAKWANKKKQKKNLEEYDNETFDKNCCSFIPSYKNKMLRKRI